MSRDEFLHRPLTVTVRTLCDRCATLRDDVELRSNEHYKVRGTFCPTCFLACCDEAYEKMRSATLC